MNKKGEKQQASQSDVGSRQQSKQPKVDEKLQAPQPVRSHPDMVALVTEQLRRDPFPVIRQPSPKVTGFGNTPMGAAGVDSQSGIASVLDSSGSVGGRKIISPSLPAPLGVYQLAELAGNAYLGDRISFHGSHMTGGRSGDFTRPHSRSTSPSAAARPASGLDSAPFNAFNLQRAYSLEGMQEYISSVPCMIRMPVSKEYHQLGDSLENIPKNSWLVPYMIAACPPSILRHLMMLPVLFSHLNSHASGGDKIAATQPFVSPMEVPAARFPYHAAVHSKADNIPESSLTVDRIKSHNDISGAHFFYGFGRPHHMIRIPLNEKQSLLYSKDKLEQLQQQQLQQQQRTIYEHQGVIDATAAPHTVEAATVEAPRDAVDPSASVFYPSADGKPRSSVVRRTNSPGLLVSALNFPKSWHSLGVVWLSKDPSWSPWEAKIVLLLDNYLLECTVDGLSIIGYAQLCKANVVKTTYPSTAATRFRQTYQRMNAHDVEASSNDSRLSNVVVLDAIATNDANSKVSSGGSRMRSSSGGQPLPPLPSINESQTFTSAGYSMDSLQDMHDADAPTMDFPSGLNSPQSARDLTPNRSRRSPYQTHGGELCSSALLITCYTTSDLQNCPTKTFWLTVTSEELLDGIASALSKASKLTVDDVFHFPGRRQFTRSDSNRSSREEVDADSGLLGRGKCSSAAHPILRSMVKPAFPLIVDQFMFDVEMNSISQVSTTKFELPCAGTSAIFLMTISTTICLEVEQQTQLTAAAGRRTI